MKNLTLILLLLTTSLSLSAQQEREQIAEQYKWDLSGIFQNNEEWHQAKTALVAEMAKADSFKGTFTGSAQELLAALQFSSEIGKDATRLFVYVSMQSDLDVRNMEFLGMKQEMRQILSDYSAKTAFMQPDILATEWEIIAGYLAEEPALKPYEKGLKDLFRLKEHTPGEAEGRILGLTGMVSEVPNSVYSIFTNAEMPNPEVTLNSGETVTLDSPGYAKYRALPDREDRALVFRTFFENLENFQATLGELLYGGIKKDVFRSKAYNYNSSLEARLAPENIPTDVYHSLVSNVNANLNAFHRYLKIKRRMLGLDTLRYMDLYAPVVKDLNLNYEFGEAQEVILKALSPLGDEYVGTVKRAFNERWIDVYPSPGKRSGAYSNGAHYEGHPYILLNYNNLYSDVSTTAHELGHTMQSYYSNKSQPYPTARYTTFVAEVASTFNEVLLFEHIIKTIEEDDVKLSLLMDRLNGFKGTLFRQTQFAEFELKMHEAVEQGLPLTGQTLSELYLEIVKKYYGHDQGICMIDDYVHMEWSYIPHFYYNYYVFQYSTSFTASISLAKRVLDGVPGASEKYMEFLSAGGSDDPIVLLKNAGVEMTGSEVFDSTIAAMNDLMDQMEEILDRMER
ncbi:MAG: oligoendopeptidase F [Bacteroidota bacterium]